MKNEITIDEWRAAIEETSGTPDDVPPGWMTVAQFGNMMGYRQSAASENIRRLRSANRLDVKRFTIRTGDKLLSVAHYRLKKK